MHNLYLIMNKHKTIQVVEHSTKYLAYDLVKELWKWRKSSKFKWEKKWIGLINYSGHRKVTFHRHYFREVESVGLREEEMGKLELI